VKLDFAFVTEKNLTELPEFENFPYSCKYCLYWESPQAFHLENKETSIRLLNKKLQWFKNVREEFGECAILIYVDKKPVGYAQYAPPEYFPNVVNYPVVPSPDAVFISCLFIFNKIHRRKGLCTILLNAVIENLEKINIRAVETIARKKNDENPSGSVDLYLQNNFIIYKDDKEFPLMRLDL
jgi:hypothetical protein